LFVSGFCGAHELTPTYPELSSSYVTGVVSTKLKMWNARMDVNYFKIEVSDKDWNPVPFVTNERLFKLSYGERREIEVFLPIDTSATYICTKSMLDKEKMQRTVISSKVCSKIK
jgi:hypothetical protein